MTWQQYILIAWFTLGIVLGISTFGKPAPKKTAQGLAIGTLINVGLIILVVTL